MGDKMALKDIITLYHGSDREIFTKDIILPGPRETCDFGKGFYLTDNKNIAEEWVCNESTAIINVYELDASATAITELTGTDWLRVIIGFRKGQYSVKFKSNVVYGLIADDRLFPSLDSFIDGTIGDKRLEKCLSLVKLGNQYCIKETYQCLTFVDSYKIESKHKKEIATRSKDRRTGMSNSIKNIIRHSIDGEKYIEDYLKDGDWHEV